MSENPQLLCSLIDLPEGTSRGFVLNGTEESESILAVHKAGKIVAYKNSCPHTGGPLDWVPHQFLSGDGEHIQCATHDALFRISDGYCVAGPCSGQSLQVVEVEIKGAQLFVSGT